MTKIKICGITNIEDGRNAVELGADFIGFVFYEKSPRNVTPEKARELSSALNGVKKVGLFVDEDPAKVRNIADFVGIDVLQFHGNESPDYCRKFADREVWKAFRVKDEGILSVIPTYDSVDAVLLDAYVEGTKGGTGHTFNWDLAVRAKWCGEAKWSGKANNIVLAGGLDPSNVARAMIFTYPYAVDVSSGVEESKGKKSYDKMKRFIEIVKIGAKKLDERNYLHGDPLVKVYGPDYVEDFGTGDISERAIKEPFFKATPYLWDGKRVLDLGCGGPSTGDLLRELYPTIDYTGGDIIKGEGIDIRADATNTIPFMGLKFGKEFDTISCFAFLPLRYFSIPFKNIRHLRKYLKDDGHLVNSFTQTSWHRKPELYWAVRDAFKITEERIYSWGFQRDENSPKVTINEHYLISVHKK